MAENLILPNKIFHGLGTFSKLSDLSGSKAIIVTGQGSMKSTGYIDKAIELLKGSEFAVEVFDGVEADPSIETVMRGAELMKTFQPDWIIGLGGCSAIDAAKAMWVFYEYPETKFEDIIPPFTIKTLRNKAKFVAIPSTSGTGTEVTCVSVITDREKGTKYPLVSYELCPDVAIVDGEVCKSMPPHVTANTGLDALAHALEAYVTPLADDYTDCMAERAVENIFKALPKVYKDGNDMEFRQTMHDASCLAGMSFTNALLGIVHSMAHQVGGMFGVPHGRANAILLPNVIRFNSQESEEKYSKLAKVIGEKSSEGLAYRIEKLREEVGVEGSFKDFGVDPKAWSQKINILAKNAMADACTGCNPRKPTHEDLVNLLNLCFNGEIYK
jgi:alcohol dehydrogenase class IV